MTLWPFSSVSADLEIDNDPEMIADPDPLARLIERECGDADGTARLRMRWPGTDTDHAS